MQEENEPNWRDFDYDDNDERILEMLALRLRMDKKNAWQAESMSDVQTDEMGDARLAGAPRGYEAFGFIYILETQDDRIKIGFSRNLRKRLMTARYGLGCRTRLIAFFPAGTSTESWLQTKFRDYRIRGDVFERDDRILLFAWLVGFPEFHPRTWDDRVPTEEELVKFKEFY